MGFHRRSPKSRRLRVWSHGVTESYREGDRLRHFCRPRRTWLKNSHWWIVRFIANAYTDICRSVPVLVVMIWLFFSLPSLLTIPAGRLPFASVRNSPPWQHVPIYLAAILGDLFRSGIDSVQSGQIDVARTLGFSWLQVQSSIVLPQAIRLVLAPLLGQYIATLLLSSLASVIAVEEASWGQNLIANRYHSLEIYSTVPLSIQPCTYQSRFLAKYLGSRTNSRRGKHMPL